ncbi:hypothetical protein C8R42DRAFT_652636 [Lentinula raphanica]|nr:hypothetical protein C8R42DRAFT_652636 [Lentinula raphanica]
MGIILRRISLIEDIRKPVKYLTALCPLCMENFLRYHRKQGLHVCPSVRTVRRTG